MTYIVSLHSGVFYVREKKKTRLSTTLYLTSRLVYFKLDKVIICLANKKQYHGIDPSSIDFRIKNAQFCVQQML